MTREDAVKKGASAKAEGEPGHAGDMNGRALQEGAETKKKRGFLSGARGPAFSVF